MKNLEIVPATIDRVKQFYGNKHIKSFRGYVALLDGYPVGVAGLTYDHILFSDISDELRPYKKDIVRTAKNLIKDIKYPISAIANENEPMAVRLLTRLGFTHISGQMYWRTP